jgi:hypothetical protein
LVPVVSVALIFWHVSEQRNNQPKKSVDWCDYFLK